MDAGASAAREAAALRRVEPRVVTVEPEFPRLPGNVAPGQLTALLGQLPTVVWTTDHELRFTFSWGGGLVRLGLQPGQLIGKTLFEYLGVDSEQFGPIQAHRMALRGFTVAYDMPWSEGMWHSVVRPLRSTSGEIIGTLGLGFDMAPQLRARSALEGEREALELIARGAPLEEVLECLCTALERQTATDARACVLPLDPARMTWGKAIGPRLPQAFLHAFEGLPAVEGQGACGTAVARRRAVIVEDVTTHPCAQAIAHLPLSYGLLAYVTVPILASDERPLGTFALYRGRTGAPGQQELLGLDVAARTAALAIEQRLATELLASHALQLERSNAELERFAYVSSHDLQEPLRTVASFSQLLARKLGPDLDPGLAGYVETITEAVARMQQLIDDLLAYSRIGCEQPSNAAVESGEVLEQALSDLDAAIRASRAAITHDPLPVVAADPALLRVVFQNLISNGIKFRAECPPRIHIGARREGSEWVFSVRDDGIGIEEEQRAQLFKLFQRAHDRKRYPGTGMGLATCKKIVERHGGRIWAESRPAHGSTFYFTFPSESAAPAAP